MNNYLLQLLKEVKTLIIPGLGALTVTNESTGEILFMPYLKFDDGTLAKHIASKENMELNDATNLISKFVREVTAELDKGNSYDMYQFGRFIKVDGEIAFEVWNGNADSAPVVEEKEIIVPPVVEKPIIKEEVVELPKVEVSSDKDEEENLKEKEIVVPPVIIETPKVETPSVTEEKVIPPVAPVVEKPEVKAPVADSKIKKEANVPKKEAPKKEKVVKEPKPKKKSSVLSYILWGLLVLILGSGTFIAIKFDSLKKDFPILAELAGDNDDVAKGSDDVKVLEDEADVNIDSNTDSEPIPEDQVQIVEDKLPENKTEEKAKKPAPVVKENPAPKPVKEKTPKPATKPITKPAVTVNKKPVTKTPATTSGSSASFDSSKSFHVIAGSFGSEANANKLAAKLRSQGFGDAAVTMHNGMHRVSVKGFATLNEATAEAATIQSSVPGAWVLKM
ncbi:Cell division protein FtsN [compost metagenome]